MPWRAKAIVRCSGGSCEEIRLAEDLTRSFADIRVVKRSCAGVIGEIEHPVVSDIRYQHAGGPGKRQAVGGGHETRTGLRDAGIEVALSENEVGCLHPLRTKGTGET